MNTTSALIVGCDAYLIENPLAGAVNDANQVAKMLAELPESRFKNGEINVLADPTHRQLDDAIIGLVYESQATHKLIFFAGHSCVLNNDLYMAAIDADSTKINATALNLSNIIKYISEGEFCHYSLILDSCFSGALQGALSSLSLNPALGNSGSISLEVLAGASGNQYAGEKEGGGIFTGALVRAIDKWRKQAFDSDFDLNYAGKVLSSELTDQEPAFWGIRLTSPKPIFSKLEPNIDSSAPDECARAKTWQAYLSFNNATGVEDAIEVIRKFVAGGDAGQLELAKAVARAELPNFNDMQQAIALSKAQLMLSGAGLLEERSERIELYNNFDRRVSERIRSSICNEQFDTLFASRNSPTGDYINAPIRMSWLLGILGLASRYPVFFPSLGHLTADPLLMAGIQKYDGFIRPIDERQAPGFVSFCFSPFGEQHSDFKDGVIGRLLNGALGLYGRIPKIGLNANEALQVLRYNSQNKPIPDEWASRPSELLSAIIAIASCEMYDDAWDFHIIELDKISLNYFSPVELANAFTESPVGKHNLLKLGLGIWSFMDFRDFVKGHLSGHTLHNNLSSFHNIEYRILYEFCSLIYLDRSPWHLCLDYVKTPKTTIKII